AENAQRDGGRFRNQMHLERAQTFHVGGSRRVRRNRCPVVKRRRPSVLLRGEGGCKRLVLGAIPHAHLQRSGGTLGNTVQSPRISHTHVVPDTRHTRGSDAEDRQRSRLSASGRTADILVRTGDVEQTGDVVGSNQASPRDSELSSTE